MKLKHQERYHVLYNNKNGCWEVMRGRMIVLYRGQLHGCELFCQQNGYVICNREEINQIKLANLPMEEEGGSCVYR